MTYQVKRVLSGIATLALAIALSGCGGGSNAPVDTYTIGGTLSGLGNGLSVTLRNNGGNSLTVNGNGSFTFSNALASGDDYAVTVGTQPAGQTCAVANASGTVAVADVTNVTVTCTTNTYTIGGTLSGLGNGLSVALLNNGGNALAVNANGPFTFGTAVASGATYAVTVGTQPVGQTCTVTNGSGTVGAANVANVTVACAATTYTVGGTLSGLGNGLSVALLNNGGNSLAVNANGPFTFSTALASGATYAVTVGTQPAGQTCTVSNGSGTIAGANVASVLVTCAYSNVFIWKDGSNLVAPWGDYGVPGVPAPDITPGGRNWSASWKDPSGNFWIFGGQGWDVLKPPLNFQGKLLNDLWQYNPTTGNWTFWTGSPLGNATGVYGTLGVPAATNVPGARESAMSWTDAGGNLWLFGGHGADSNGLVGYLNDLWKYDPSTSQWTWIAGPNTADSAGVYGTLGTEAAGNLPGGRYVAAVWTDNTGNVWLFGGYGLDSVGATEDLNDLWRYNPVNGRWTWMGGSDTNSAAGVYGTKGTPALANVPGARSVALPWTDGTGNLWLLGGLDINSGYLNDLWKYSTSTGQWTWMSGLSGINASPGVYGTRGTPAPSNLPGARGGAVGWADTSGNLWAFGGVGFDSVGATNDELNDLWKYNIASGNWTWVKGSNLAATAGVYGTLGTPSASTQPGGRDSGTAWIDSNGHAWLFGGAGYDSTGVYDSYGMNDIFEYIP